MTSERLPVATPGAVGAGPALLAAELAEEPLAVEAALLLDAAELVRVAVAGTEVAVIGNERIGAGTAV